MLLRRGRLQIANKEPHGVLPCVIRVAAKTQHAAEYDLPARHILDVQAQAADQRADLVDLTD